MRGAQTFQRSAVRLVVCGCAALLLILATWPAAAQYPGYQYPPTQTPDYSGYPPGQNPSDYGGYPGAYPGGTGYPGFGSTGNLRFRNPNTGTFSSSQYSPDSGYNSPTQGGRTARTPRGGRATPTPKGATPAPGQGPASTRAKGQQTVVTGGPPTAPRASAAQPSASVATFTVKPLADVAIVYLSPFQAGVALGQAFETNVSLSNPAKKEFQAIEVTMGYDPTVLEPIRLDDEAIAPLLAATAQAVVYTDAGILVYRAKLSKPLDAQAADLFRIRWRTLAANPLTNIAFVSWGGHRTALLDKSNENILGGPTSAGSLSMTLEVFSPQERLDGPPIGNVLFASSQKASRGGAHLHLVANKKNIPLNEDFYVGVWFENPRMLDVSKVALKIRFDPNVLEVVDDDGNNWVTTGVNVFDGDYHDKFPFDIHVENSASNDSGLIHYVVACTQRRVLPDRGYIARVRFRPKATGTTRIEFELGPDDDPFRTQVTFLGNDILGSPERGDSGVENLTVTLGPPELPRLLVTEK